MTSEKYFSKWVKEAGRGHIAAFLSWGILAGYTMVSMVRMNTGAEFVCFGIGSSEFPWICEALGTALSFLEFTYLLQPGKLDFYYGLPVRKETIFWSRYVHGMLHFLIPMVLAMVACGVFESTYDMEFMASCAGYTGRSILLCAMVFLIFYHIGILLLTACGKILPAALGYGAVLFYGTVLAGNALTTLAENYFHTYYRIPLLEKLDVVLTPFSLAVKLTGTGVYGKAEVWEYVPPVFCLAAGIVWTVLPFLLFSAAQKRRKTERVGKLFAVPLAEQTAELLLSFGAGVWCTSFSIELSGLAATNPGAAFVLGMFPGVLAACAVHFLLEWGCGRMSGRHKGNRKCSGVFLRKWQLALECAAVVCVGAAFSAGASSFDLFWPKEDQVEAVGISVGGLDMNYDVYQQILLGERYNTERQLERYLLTEEGKDAAMKWALSLAQKRGSSGDVDEYTRAVVCCHMKNGRKMYRTYPVSEEDLNLFSAVYESDEYKEKAYSRPNGRYVADARFLWSDGVTDVVIKLEDEEKEALLDAWQRDVDDLKMGDLRTALPLGFVDIDSEMRLASAKMPVYPFFERTCGFLEDHGVPVHKTLLDYPVSSVTVMDKNVNGTGSQKKYYEEPEEIESWKKKMIPQRLDLQPLLYPLDYSQEIKAEAKDETANSAVYVFCYQLEE